MRDTATIGRSAATGGRRLLLLLTLLTLLHAAFLTGSSDAPLPEAGRCLTHTAAPAASGPSDRACDSAAPVVRPSEGGDKHPGRGVRRKHQASACHLRHHVPTGSGGKAIDETAAVQALAAPPDSASWAVVPATLAPSPRRATVLRC
ncbi:hypothetical protein SSP35_23_00130 [Streptomyces sp. NBRC 110611]|uniref:hypothetical protein n=1 Tax=Streptomyces sp. NBRC 110611 TaxID=1621259 RepID=UPI00082E5F8B|nr:hypothetical protein [Streptomyces sp. NBRC 110611]GAU70823.1 hypothetical protein SSP35_23_00130 [Streptomyces sp. NBRC 110611]